MNPTNEEIFIACLKKNPIFIRIIIKVLRLIVHLITSKHHKYCHYSYRQIVNSNVVVNDGK